MVEWNQAAGGSPAPTQGAIMKVGDYVAVPLGRTGIVAEVRPEVVAVRLGYGEVREFRPPFVRLLEAAS